MAQSAIEVARAIESELRVLRSEFAALQQEVERAEPRKLQERLAVLEHRVNELARFETDIRRLTVIEDRVAELKRLKDEADRRFWQFVLLFVGGLVTLAINFTLTFLRK